MSTTLTEEIRRLQQKIDREEARLMSLAPADAPCCAICWLDAHELKAMTEQRRRAAWLAILQEKAEERGAT